MTWQTLECISHQRRTWGWTREETGHCWRKPPGSERCLDGRHTSYVNAPAARREGLLGERCPVLNNVEDSVSEVSGRPARTTPPVLRHNPKWK